MIRKTHLDVAGFDEAAKNFETKASGVTDALVKAKMVGRNADGTPLEPGATNYKADPDGLATPLQSHVRRANPRMQGELKRENPRLLRRGFSYGPYLDEGSAPDADRGQFFIAYNANISEQFEVIQRWISGGNGTGIASWHGDPLLAPKRPEGIRNFRFVHDKELVNVNLPSKPIGTLQWGLYAFTPAREGLKLLAELVDQRTQQMSSAKGDETAATCPFKAANIDLDDSADAWKLMLENADDEHRPVREALWANIRQNPDGLKTNYATLIGTKQGVSDLLNDDGSTYSASTYRARMKDTVGEQYLGYDDAAEHAAECSVLNAFLDGLDPFDMFNKSFETAKAILTALPEQTQSTLKDGRTPDADVKLLGRRLESEAFIFDTIAQLCVDWFGIPKDDLLIGGAEDLNNPLPHCPRDILPASLYVFGPRPTPYLTQHAQDRSPRVLKAVADFVSSGAPGVDGDLLHHMRAVQAQDKSGLWTDKKTAEFMTGACFGFAGPVSGSFRSVLYDWIKEENLWRLHQRFHAYFQRSGGNMKATIANVLRPAILNSMCERPVPDLLYRTKAKEDDLCVFSIRSAIADGGDPEMFLFGGDYEADPNAGPRHKCPGKSMAMSVMAGAFAAVFEYEQIQPEGPLSLWLK